MFLPSMLPTLLGSNKPAAATSLMNVAIVTAIACAQARCRLWLSVATAGTIIAVWGILAVQAL